MKSGNLIFLELSGQLQVCKGTALLLISHYLNTNIHFFITSTSFLLRMRYILDKVVDKIETHILYSVTFSSIVPLMR